MSQRDPAPSSSTGKDAGEAAGARGQAGRPVDRSPEAPPHPRGGHGYRSEVSWRGGQGRQPYTNQDPDAPQAPAALPEFEQGDRGRHSGVNQAQMEAVRRKP